MAVAASSSSSSSSSLSPCSDDLTVPNPIKILALNDNDDLLQYTSDERKTSLVEKIGYQTGSCVALVGNYVYVVGGLDDNHIPTSQVVFYDLITDDDSFPLAKHQAPSLNSPKFTPILIVMGHILFAFSYRFQHATRVYSSLYPPSSLSAPEPLPICEFLDTSSPSNKWCPLTSFPTLPPPALVRLYAYSISSYAVQPNQEKLFLSFGLGFQTIGFFSTCYCRSKDIWTDVLSHPLPFVGEGKFIDNICFGFPSGMDRHDCDYVASYKVDVDWGVRIFNFIPLATYSLLSNSTLTDCPTFFSFEPVSSRVLTTIRVKVEELYRLELEVLELLPLEVEVEEGQRKFRTNVCSTTTYTMYHHVGAIVGAYW
ncbi:uncharacterized protein LOC141612519 isoform X3 [Silene latifolia]|uniref:uncharacterized protein LOC141612519 isoform X2 n=1 Tax=Silene latifolia TaxID=37657 RepID=UPI003D78A9F7